MSLYSLKPRFQSLLQPLASALARRRVSANQVTLTAALGSLVVGAIVFGLASTRWIFLLIPIWLFARMALNALDGMIARDFNQMSKLGAYLNELSDVVSDTAIYLPFVLIAPFNGYSVAIVIYLCVLSEFAGVLGPTVGAERRYDGPMGKSDRALVFGVLGLAVACTTTLPAWLAWLFPVMAVALLITIVNRVRGGLAASRATLASLPQSQRPSSQE
ncbi:MAG: CDP-alcohol phosphatidyltransferase family protein [Pseudomonadota bacterium]